MRYLGYGKSENGEGRGDGRISSFRDSSGCQFPGYRTVSFQDETVANGVLGMPKHI
jgi:hypothetical protein